jgi:ATP-dependent Clp protease ATP-binding subunit ClpC
VKELSVGARLAWQIAAGEAGAAMHKYIEKEHILLGICSLEKIVMLGQREVALNQQAIKALQTSHNTIENVLNSFELDTTSLRRRLREKIGKGNYVRTEKVVHRSESCKNMFNRAAELATSTNKIFCLHLLSAILEDSGKNISTVLKEAGVKPEDLRRKALRNVEDVWKLHDNTEAAKQNRQEAGESSTHYLDRYGRDLTQEAQEGKLGPFIGRRKELLQIIQTLARRTKNNPVLVGEAGVGKTAIVEALAIRVAQNKDRHVLEGKRIIELNMGGLVGGTKYRGEFEQRLKGIIDEARHHPEIIVFVDEIHNVVGAGRAEGSMDAANLLKPSLARGDLRCIGATTISEYRRYIESDSALERRFEKIIVNEPSPEEALEILKGIKPKLEEHHKVHITDKALEAAVMLSVRFDGDHQLPDKAIDLVDKAGARTQIPVLSMVMDRKNAGAGRKRKVTEFTEKSVVTELTIAHVLSEKVGLPLEIVTGHLEGTARSRLLDLESYIKEHLIGQDEAVEKVSQRLLMAHAGLSTKGGPLAVFLFLGPTGVGKTELARLLAEYLFGNRSEMIRLDMSEYMEEHSVSKLIGSPPGYVGYLEEGQLTGRLRSNPYSVVLLDEIEKAHPRVFDLFLQVFDDGRLTDSKGRTIDAKNAIFIMTSNIQVDNIRETPPIYDGRKKVVGVREKLGRFMRLEMINRIDEVLVFRSLSEEDIRKILKPILEAVCVNLQELYEVGLRIDEEAERFLAQKGYSSAYGARELKRTVERFLQMPLSRLIMGGELQNHNKWVAINVDSGLSIVPYESEQRDPYETEIFS